MPDMADQQELDDFFAHAKAALDLHADTYEEMLTNSAVQNLLINSLHWLKPARKPQLQAALSCILLNRIRYPTPASIILS